MKKFAWIAAVALCGIALAAQPQQGRRPPQQGGQGGQNGQGDHRGPTSRPSPDQLFDMADRIDVSLDEMSAEAAVRAQRALEVHGAAALQRAERRDADGFGPDVRVKLVLLGEDHRQADAVDGDAVPRRELGRERGRDPQPEAAAGRLALDDFPDAFNETREHIPLSGRRDRARRSGARGAPPTKTRDPAAAGRRRRRGRAA